jgi:hypothetical protein
MKGPWFPIGIRMHGPWGEAPTTTHAVLLRAPRFFITLPGDAGAERPAVRRARSGHGIRLGVGRRGASFDGILPLLPGWERLSDARVP